MGTFLLSVAAFIVTLGVLISFHEFGHFWVARRLGVKVLRFSVGFGRPLWMRRGRDGVEYVIAALPLGGYVKMLDEREAAVSAAELPQAFNRQSVGRRMAIVAAGPVANFLLAFVVYWIVFVIGIPALKAVIGAPPEGSRAAASELSAGDEILSVNGEPVATFQQLRLDLIDRALAGEPATLAVRGADGGHRTVVLDFDGVRVDPQYLFDDLGLEPLQPPVPAVLGEIVEGSPAQAAGLARGDRVLAINGTPVTLYWELFDWVRAHPGAVAEFDIERGGERMRLVAVIATETRDGRAFGRLGAGMDVPDGLWDNLVTEHRLDVGAAAAAAVAQTAQMSALTLKMLYRMVLGDVSVKNVTGPIQIAQFAGYTASIGLVSFLSFIAIMSVSLAVLNLLPVPVLDGGHLLYYAVEAVKGSPMSERAQAVGQQVGLTILIALMGLAFYNDILRLLD
jgi:regulator of sigma E protease